MKFTFSALFFLLFLGCGLAQLEKKILPAQKTTSPFVIDGKLNDSAWSQAPVGKNFRMLIPGNGDPIPPDFKTELKVLYSDEALYLGLTLYDPHPDSILTQLTERDTYNENCDYVLISVNPFNDGLNDFNFAVTAAGTQTDSRTTLNGDDPSLNSIWQSAVQITEFGWTCEIEIPYISLRFPENGNQDWGLNVIRSIRRNREQYSWNFIDRSSGYSAEFQAGVLQGVKNIEPPVRLSFLPYVSAYADDFAGTTTLDFNTGLDLKYGINQSFTLDMTLIPDFGQVAFDNQFLNLSPFENEFTENRQFFTEGTELFEIGNIFYSRRIGGAPDNISLNDSNIVEVQTEFTRLLNATKISGRTQGNLGIGVLNAITDNNFSLTTDSAGQNQRQLAEPLTNYNVLVLDQRFNRNSSLSFVNTNVLRDGAFADANVAALLGSVFSKSGQFKLDASLKRSDRIGENQNQNGYEAALRFGDVDGHWRWATNQTLITKNYNPRDLGFLTRNNQIRNYSEVEYLTFKPKGPFNRTSYTLYSIVSSLYQPQRFEEFVLGFNTFFLLRDFTGTGIRLRFKPVESYDFFEPRQFGDYFIRPASGQISYFISTDYRKPLALDLDFDYNHTVGFNRDAYFLNLEPRIRLGDHFFAIPQIQYNLVLNDYGYATNRNSFALMGQRDIRDFTALIEGRYVFNPVSSLSLRLRQNWNRVKYQQIFQLQPNGRLAKLEGQEDAVKDINFNVFNLDLRYSWWFAPASEISVLYRVAIAQRGEITELNYQQNLEQILNAPIQNNFSLRLNYFLDYNRTRNIFRRKKAG
jgi:hypothetical protein